MLLLPSSELRLRLVSLQASLADTENLLDEAVQKCDQLIEEDKCGEIVRCLVHARPVLISNNVQ